MKNLMGFPVVETNTKTPDVQVGCPPFEGESGAQYWDRVMQPISDRIDETIRQNAVIAPLARHVFESMVAAKACSGLDAKRLFLSSELMKIVTEAKPEGSGELAMWGLPVYELKENFRDCYQLAMEDGSLITVGFSG